MTSQEEVIDLESSKAVWDYLDRKFNVTADVQSFEGLQTAINTVYDGCNGIQDYVSKLCKPARANLASAILRVYSRSPNRLAT